MDLSRKVYVKLLQLTEPNFCVNAQRKKRRRKG